MAGSLLPVIGSAALTLGAIIYSAIWLPIRMRAAYRQSLLTLARAVEAKDAAAVGHGERVARYVVTVAKEMRVPRKLTQMMEYAAFLQDIGNVRVPYAILNKPDRLEAGELDIVRNHCIVGAEIVSKVKFLHDIAPIIRHHHEEWDGSGYPDGLKDENIPLGARILAVCTAFDAMTHPRVFRGPISPDEAIRDIRAESGSRYDPAVVKAFLRAMKKLSSDHS
jgi:HD-GYP domain-containing protein (c-di-GMP phosphodiesterase class II)